MNAEQEFEMLVNVLVAHKRVLDAVGWCGEEKKFITELNTACTALLRVKEMCSEENQRLAEMTVV